MSKSWPIIFRDPVHNMIVFEDTNCDRLLLDLINTKEVQRLHRIKQLGFTELVFPAANHSRFAHSLGVLQIARQFLDHFQRLEGSGLDEGRRALVLAASLLHDIGHGPFSHAFEKVTGQKHEQRTLEIIQSGDTEVNQRLRRFDAELPRRLALFFAEDIDESGTGFDLPPYLTQVVSSQLDADRCDYLLRDSYATGTNYGNYDLSWLLAQLRLQPGGKRFYLGAKALSAAEAYLYARFHMYRTVYFHKTTRAAEVMLRLLFQRYKELVDAADSPGAKREVVPDVPIRLFLAFTERMSLTQYLALDDHTISEFLKACAGAQDLILRDVSDGLLNRRLFKAVDASGASGADVAEFRVKAQDCLPRDWMPQYSFVVLV